MRRGYKVSYLVFCLFLAPHFLFADTVPGLYEAEVLVVDQELEERSKAFRSALDEVLVRVSGRGTVGSLAVLEDVMQNASRYVQQYRYRTVPTNPEAAEAQGQILWVRFDEDAVNEVLRANNLPVWGRTRPAVLVWLVIDYRGRRELVSNSMDHSARISIEAHARQRGLPLRLPLLDLADRSSLRVGEVWANFEDPIMKASQRYQPGAVLVGRAYRSNSGIWNTRWTLYLEGRRQDWDFQGSDLAGALVPGIDYTTDALSRRFAQVGNIQASYTVLIKIKDINGLENYARAVKYLTSLSDVAKVQTYQVEVNSVTFELTARSGRLGVAQAVSLGHTLVPELSDPSPKGTKPANSTGQQNALLTAPDLVYRLLQ